MGHPAINPSRMNANSKLRTNSAKISYLDAIRALHEDLAVSLMLFASDSNQLHLTNRAKVRHLSRFRRAACTARCSRSPKLQRRHAGGGIQQRRGMRAAARDAGAGARDLGGGGEFWSGGARERRERREEDDRGGLIRWKARAKTPIRKYKTCRWACIRARYAPAVE